MTLKKLSLILAFSSISYGAVAISATLRIMETTDLHTNMVSYDYYKDKTVDNFGLERTATLIGEARHGAVNNLLIDNGDLLQGSPLGDYAAQLKSGQIHPAYLVMNQLKYDAANLGNHDFNYGLDFLQQNLKGAHFPYVNANVVDIKTGKPLFKPYVILNKTIQLENGKKSTLRIGVIGFAPPQILQWDKHNLEGKVKVLDIVPTAKKYVLEMKSRGADIIIAVPHSGLQKSPNTTPLSENIVLDLAKVPNIDALLFGHAHGEFPSAQFSTYPQVNLSNGTINNIPSVMPGFFGNNLGIIDLQLDHSKSGWKVLSGKGWLMPIKAKGAESGVAVNAKIHSFMESWHQATLKYMHEPIGTIKTPLYSYFSQVEPGAPEAVVHLAQLWYGQQIVADSKYAGLPVLSAVAPFKVGGRQGFSYYTDVPAGNLERRNIADLYLYPNTVALVKVNGHDVRQWLEMAAGQYNQARTESTETMLINNEFPGFNFDSLAGGDLSYRIEISQAPRYDKDGKLINPNSSRIQDLTFMGKALNESQEFIVVTNNYRANGGGNFPGINTTKIILENQTENRQIVGEYLAQLSDKSITALNNWKLNPIVGTKLLFTTGAAAEKYLPAHPELKLIEVTKDREGLLLEYK